MTEYRVKDGFLWDQEYPGRTIYTEEMEVRVGDDIEHRCLSDLDASPQGGWVKALPKDGAFRFPLRKAKSFGADLIVRARKWPDDGLTRDGPVH